MYSVVMYTNLHVECVSAADHLRNAIEIRVRRRDHTNAANRLQMIALCVRPPATAQ